MQPVQRTTWGIASPVEYDVPKCAEGIMGCAQTADKNWIHTIKGTFTGGGKLSAAHFHCHAPTCLHMAMYMCDKNVTDCNNETGTLLCDEHPVYGGTGMIDNKDMDEPGFILQPPCLFLSALSPLPGSLPARAPALLLERLQQLCILLLQCRHLIL